jgi:glycogen operon protein
MKLKQKTKKSIQAGKFYPLGATLQNGGANFAVYSQYAKEIYLLLFDKADGEPTDIIKLDNCTKYIHHVFVEGIKKGQLYGFKARGEYNPNFGLRFNENKLLVDPYSKAFTGKFINKDNLLLGYDPMSYQKDMQMDIRDNSTIVPKSIVIDDEFDWQSDKPPDIPFEKLIIYEVHVKGFTKHPSFKINNPGTYLGFIEQIPYLKDLGINAVELLPVHEYYVDDFLIQKNLTNYWGYNTIGFFAPESSYSTGKYPGCQVEEFKTMVRELHKAGIEVILDVVYNHTAEGNELGPTMCFKGIDNPTYYSLTGSHYNPGRYYMNYTGCGNSLNFANTPVIRLVMDSLRYWVEKMHVDGFRFDLASVLGREEGYFYKSAAFFDTISQDPLLSRIKLIAEPWDLGTYQVGNFPIDWSEWNGRFRDCIRKFGKGDGGQIQEIGYRFTGSADLYEDDGRSAYNSINFITCHDGFTLNDLVSYNYKHNDNNLENNNDGTNDNNSWNCGYEGETEDKEILYLRKQLVKNYFCMLFFSQGTPMMLGGDEFLRTQYGNNNAYCQDNEISYFNPDRIKANSDMIEFVKKAIAFRKAHSILQRRKYLKGIDSDGNRFSDIMWFDDNLNNPQWFNPECKAISYMLDCGEDNIYEKHIFLFFIYNMDYKAHFVKIPTLYNKQKWFRKIDTSLKSGDDFLSDGRELIINPSDYYIVNPRSTVVLIGK